jgi:hypothetical protein
MISTNLQGVAELVVRRAQRQGYVIPREVREELISASLSEDLWKEVVALARPSLRYRQGRYYYNTPVSARLREEQSHQRDVHRAVRELLAQQEADRVDRRSADRVEFVQPVQVVAENGETFTLQSRDLSATGIRLVGTRRLLGQKVRVIVPRDDAAPCQFVVRVLWTCAVGEGLFENGGTFLGVEK